MTSRSRKEAKSPFTPGKTYPLVPSRWDPGFARVLMLEAEPVYLTETTLEVVQYEGYAWLGLTIDGFITGYRKFKDLKNNANPALWRYTFEMVPFEPLHPREVRKLIKPSESQATLF